MKSSIAHRVVTVQLHRTETTKTDHSVTNQRVPNGTMTGTVELRIDVDALLKRMGDRALRAKGGRTQLASGLIEVVVHRETVRKSSPSGTT